MSKTFFATRRSTLSTDKEHWRLRLELDDEDGGIEHCHLILAEERTDGYPSSYHANVHEATTITLNPDEVDWLYKALGNLLTQRKRSIEFRSKRKTRNGDPDPV